MSDPQTILQANITVCWVAATGWAVAGVVLRMAPLVAARFFLCDFLMGLGLFLTLWRDGSAPVWLAYPLADILGLAGLAALRLGVRYFVHRDQVGRVESAGILLLATLLILLQPYDRQPGYHAVVYSLTAGWLLLRATQDALSRQGSVFSLAARALVVSPLAAVSLLFFVRAATVLGGAANTASVTSHATFNVVFLFVGLVLNLAVNIALAGVVTMRLVERLELLSLTDPMTGALNRRAFSQRLELQHRQALQGTPYSLCVLDLDHFKRINDTLGHAAGDAALLHLVAVLQAGLREHDLLCRVGGEEFCLLLPDTREAGARSVAERLQQALADTPFVWEGKHWPLTASFGVATVVSGLDSAESLLQRADQAVYRAKEAGRNQVVQL
ncbi:GGDEF domain-containing protein [Vogesella urethralis]|uniref:GGDEF domain-containing protein n=1 Tax=Vogesella urethralis TaxID=2592656 RepID=UPI00118566B4|nr:GGDEF domain-containing protein [Vogesella urethralis]